MIYHAARRVPKSIEVKPAKNYGYKAPAEVRTTRPASKPVASKPVASKPVASKPVASKPVASKPAPPERARVVVTQDGTQSILEIGEHGEAVVVEASNCILVIKGSCRHLKVTGSGNQIQSTHVEHFAIEGSDNHLVVGTLSRGELKGENNEVLWGSGTDGTPEIALSGTNNRAQLLE